MGQIHLTSLGCLFLSSLFLSSALVAETWSPLYTVPVNPFTDINKETLTLDINSGSMAEVQQAIDDFRTANPSSFMVVNLNGIYTVDAEPLRLTSKQILYINGTIEAASSGATATALVFVDADQSDVGIMGYGAASVLDGMSANLNGVEVNTSGRVVIDNITVRNTGLNGISVVGKGRDVWDGQISVSRCSVTGCGESGIKFVDANQCVLVDNYCGNNGAAGIDFFGNDTSIANNKCTSNPTGILVNGEVITVYKNIVTGGSTGLRFHADSERVKAVYNTLQNCSSSGVLVDGFDSTLFASTYSGNATNVISQGSSNFILAKEHPLNGEGNNYFYPPTIDNPHNGKGRVDLTITSTSIDDVQAQLDATREANPDDVIVLKLDGTFLVGDNPLLLPLFTCVILEEGTVIRSDAATTAGYAIQAVGSPLSRTFISVSGGVIDAEFNKVGALKLDQCSVTFIDEVVMRNSGADYTDRGPSQMVFYRSGSFSQIISGCTVEYGHARGIWTKTSDGIIVVGNLTRFVNMDGIDFDAYTDESLAANNVTVDNVRTGIFIEEGSKRNVAIDNDIRRNAIGVNLFTFATKDDPETPDKIEGGTLYNSVHLNHLEENGRALRDGDNTGSVTRWNYFYNNVAINNSPRGGISSQTSDNYYSETVLIGNEITGGTPGTPDGIEQYGNTIFFNPTQAANVTWGGYVIVADDIVDTGDFIGFLNILFEPWVWSYSLNTYIYLPEEFVTETGAWTYIPRF
jgi:hypothetical protein